MESIKKAEKSLSWRDLLIAGSSAVALLASGAAFAQDAEDDDDTSLDVIEEVEEEAEESGDRLVVTGSRIQRSEFTSPAPVQVISGSISRDIGLVSPDLILSDSTVTQGQQIDASFAGFVLDNGPGSSTVDLRGLGAGRSLILVNGRRLAPSGVEGAPSSPSANLIPGTFVDRYEILLDGASSVYGSDAVAGVVNVILRKDFDGLELDINHTQPFDKGGESTALAATWGINSDRGFAGFAVEYAKTQKLERRDRDFFGGCTKDIEITTTGEIRTLYVANSNFNSLQLPTDCIPDARLVGRVSVPILGSVYYDPENSNFALGFSESNYLSAGGVGIGVDSDGDGLNDVQFIDYTQNGNQEWLDSDVFPETDNLRFFSAGEYETEILGNATVYYEALYSRTDGSSDATGSTGGGQLFPNVSADNPYNICNPNGFGVDCGLAFDQFFLSPAYSNVFQSVVGLPSSAFFGAFGRGAIGPQSVLPIVRVKGDRNGFDFDIAQSRFVTGLRGDLPFIDFGSFTNWSYDMSLAYSYSDGYSNRRGVRGDRLQFSLDTSAIDPVTGEVVCGLDNDGDGVPDGFDPSGNVCVPINMFAPSLYNGGEAGEFATQAETDYVFGDRSFTTIVEQTTFQAFATGDVLDLPAGTVAAAVGFEYREDRIDSRASDIAADGLLFGFFQDGGARGSRDLYELFGEVEIPLLADSPLGYEANLNLSGRYTDEEFYGNDTTYSIKGDYRPVSWLLLRGTYGTSYRAPNLREQFLLGQSGFNNGLGDPCFVPQAAFEADPLNPTAPATYNPTLDGREQTTLDNCRAAGIDPLTFGISPTTGLPNPTGTTSAEVITGGVTDLDPETSTSQSAGFVVEQPFFDDFDLTFGATWWKVEVENSIAEPSSQFIVNDCYVLQPGLSSPFCSRITRDATGDITLIDAGFININEDIAEGIDYNLLFEDDYEVFGRRLDLAVDLRATNRLTAEVLIVGDDGTADLDSFVDTFGFNEWNGQATVQARFDDFRFTWNTRYLGEATQFVEGIDPFGIGETCAGAANGDVDCRDFAEADAWFRHDASVGYSGDTYDIVVGVRNIFDETPPLVNSTEVTTNSNVPVGVGYDLFGRRAFVSLNKRF